MRDSETFLSIFPLLKIIPISLRWTHIKPFAIDKHKRDSATGLWEHKFLLKLLNRCMQKYHFQKETGMGFVGCVKIGLAGHHLWLDCPRVISSTWDTLAAFAVCWPR